MKRENTFHLKIVISDEVCLLKRFNYWDFVPNPKVLSDDFQKKKVKKIEV